MNGQYMLSGGQGEAFILPAADMSGLGNQIHYLNAQKRQKEQDALKAKQAQDKAFAEEQKWNPGKAWYFHTDELNGKVKNVFDLQTQIHQGDNSPETARKLRDAKWDAETTARKSQNIQELYPQLQSQINQGLDKYEDKALVKTKLNDEVLRKGSVNDFDFEKASDIKGFTGNDTFKDREWAVDFAKSIPEIVQSEITNLGNGAINDKEFKSKFYELDVNGNPKRASDGTAILKDSPEVLTAMKQEPRAVRKAAALVEAGKYKTIDEALREEYLRPYASTQVKESQTRQFAPKSSSGKTDDVTLTHAYDTEENFNLAGVGGKQVVKAYSPHEVRIGGKQSEKPVNLNAQTYIDPNTNTYYKDETGQPLVGDKEITSTRLRLVPFDTKNNRILTTTKAQSKGDNPDREWRWYVTGVMTGKDEEGVHTVKKPVMIPYDEVKDELKEKRGIDLSERVPGQYSDIEIKQIIDKDPEYSKLSPAEKVALHKKLKGQKQ